MILLTAQDISKTYMERKVLDDASFFLNEGDKVGIIGINGTGKSTFIKILSGTEEADKGKIIISFALSLIYWFAKNKPQFVLGIILSITSLAYLVEEL